MNVMDKNALWLEKLDHNDPLYEELVSARKDPADINDRFYQDLVFGTAGLRGIYGAGTNRMNHLTVGRATQGLADFLLNSWEDYKKGVVLSYDCRHHSREFAEEAAGILAGNGIPALIFPGIRSTPELSFTIRRLGALSGINMTASHNPKQYNGYKVYWKDGAQISGAISDGILREIEKLDYFSGIKSAGFENGVSNGLITVLPDEADRLYYDYVESQARHNAEELDLSIPVVYTPLNGAGSIPLRTICAERGFDGFRIVKEHENPDPDFTTVPYPNPENPQAFELAEKLGKETGAEVLIATDPDSDRMAIELRKKDGGYQYLNGNQTGGLLIAYLADARKQDPEKAGKKAGMIKSIVTGDFGRAICEANGITVFETLTGFKNICGKIDEIEKKGYEYFFGYEESIGCAPGELVRDKDGIAAGMLIIEMAAYYRKKGMSLTDVLEQLYRTYGYYGENQISIVLEGQDGMEKMRVIMDALRRTDANVFAGFTVKERIDFIHGYRDIPAQNALKFIMTDGSWFAARPSGTEPKIKFYFYTKEDSAEKSKAVLDALCDTVSSYVKGITPA